ncbi:unnamed protein product [Meganyctiphanes norvegica]|uniref:Ig-like domain-containing protein n=1 Tax=Meganyctiphanes norvegica TaxID=48144 RepID=A0AAV2QII0_MEGNR
MLRLVIFVMTMSAGALAEYQLANETMTFTMNCTSGDPVEYWLLHSTGHAYMIGKHYEEESIDVDEQGAITFESVKVSHEGTHLCVTRKEETVHAHPVHLRVRALPPSDLWKEVYEAQFITGIIAALVCATIFGLSCLVYKNRWRPQQPEDNECMIKEGQCNPAVEIEVDIHDNDDIQEEVDNNTKM